MSQWCSSNWSFTIQIFEQHCELMLCQTFEPNREDLDQSEDVQPNLSLCWMYMSKGTFISHCHSFSSHCHSFSSHWHSFNSFFLPILQKNWGILFSKWISVCLFVHCMSICPYFHAIAPDKRKYLENIFLTSPRKYMLCVFIRSTSLRHL